MSHAIAQMYASVEVPPPTASRMTVCYGFVCRLRVHLDFTPGRPQGADRHLLNKGKATPEDERRALQLAVQWFDRRMGPILARRGAWRAPISATATTTAITIATTPPATQ